MRFTKAAAGPAVAMSARFFSQTTRAAQEEDRNEQAVVEDAIKSAEDKSTLESSPAASAASEEGAPIFVSNMTFDATDMHLREAFSKYGDITSIKIGRDGRGLSRGYAHLVPYTCKYDFANVAL